MVQVSLQILSGGLKRLYLLVVDVFGLLVSQSLLKVVLLSFDEI